MNELDTQCLGLHFTYLNDLYLSGLRVCIFPVPSLFFTALNGDTECFNPPNKGSYTTTCAREILFHWGHLHRLKRQGDPNRTPWRKIGLVYYSALFVALHGAITVQILPPVYGLLRRSAAWTLVGLQMQRHDVFRHPHSLLRPLHKSLLPLLCGLQEHRKLPCEECSFVPKCQVSVFSVLICAQQVNMELSAENTRRLFHLA